MKWVVLAMVAGLTAGSGYSDDDYDAEERQRKAALQAYRMQDWNKRKGDFDFSVDDLSKLRKNKCLVGNRSYRAMSGAYSPFNDSPHFITTDSLLNAYHVLYAESIRRLEEELADRAPGILEHMLSRLQTVDAGFKGNPELVAAARRRAQLVLGVGAKLLDYRFSLGDEDLDAIIADEAMRVKAAQGVYRPDWLGDAEVMTLDYSRYKPRGFYTKTLKLKKYFQTVSWLQSIPFRLNNDEEFLAVLMMARTLEKEQFSSESAHVHALRFFNAYSLFIGVPNHWDILQEVGSGKKDRVLDVNGKWFRETSRKYRAEDYQKEIRINDHISRYGVSPNYRVISAYRTPAALLFQKTTYYEDFKRLYPTGLEVAIALGSDFAREQVNEPEKEKVLKTIEEHKGVFEGNSLYFEYLEMLRLLLDEPEPDAPEFMKSDAWKAKNCNTVLGGWAQLRSTWILQTENVMTLFGGMPEPPSGFVESEPAFFSKLAGLARSSRKVLDASGLFSMHGSDDLFGLKAEWDRLEETAHQLETLAHKQLRGVPFSEKENEFIRNYGGVLKKITLQRRYPNRDDYPKIADVFSSSRGNQHLLVGIAQPRIFYVLYPWKGNEVLCSGAVTPYYEFVSKQRLTDEEWKIMLNLGAEPPAPKWFQPLESRKND